MFALQRVWMRTGNVRSLAARGGLVFVSCVQRAHFHLKKKKGTSTRSETYEKEKGTKKESQASTRISYLACFFSLRSK